MVLAAVRRTLERRRLIEPGMRVLAACSGGPDSAAMLLALARLSSELDFELYAASVDHGLRPDSARDAAAAEAQARMLGVPFEALSVRVEAGASIQAAAREARYAALLAAARSVKAQRIAVGHTREDQAETVLMRLLRGAGLTGLSAIEPLREDGVARPLIDCARAEVQAFARAHFREIASDPANRDERFERVRVRHHLLPALLAEDKRVVEHLAELADDARDAASVLQAASRSVLERCRREAGSLGISELVVEAPAIRRGVLRLWAEHVSGERLGRAHMTQLDDLLLRGGEVWLPGGYAARRTSDQTQLEMTLTADAARGGR
jgi:tRNA(Ile)-lysidine synthase